MKMYIYIFGLLFISLCYVEAFDITSRYKWVEYENGVIPANALKAGVEYSNNIYLGMAFHQHKFHVGKIIATVPSMKFICKGKILEQTENIWIFTTDRPNKFQWLRLSTNSMDLPNNAQLYPVKVDLTDNEYVARAGKRTNTAGNFECEDFIVKCNKPLQAVNVDGNLEEFTEFEVLVYAH